MSYDKEVISEKKKKLQAAAEKFQKETMEKLEKISNRDDLSPEEMMNLVYQDDKGAYAPDKKFYLDEIAKPLLEDEDMGGADMDLSKVLSKAYDLLESTDPENVKIATNALRAIPTETRKNISKELKEFQRSIAGKSGEEMEDIYADIQNDKTENVPGLGQALSKLNPEHQDLTKTYALASIMINSLNK
jgi:phage-related protein